MKKVLLLFIMLTATTALNLSWAQLGVGQQMRNNNFESWNTESGTSYSAPDYWHTINSATGSLSGSAGSGDFVKKESGNPGGTGNYCVKLTCVNKGIWFITVKANGSITTGRFNAASASAGDAVNCTYTSTNSNYNQPLTAFPDSVYIWTKTNLGNSGTADSARFNIVIHDNTVATSSSLNGDNNHHAIYQDPIPGAPGQNTTDGVVNTTWSVNEAKVVAKATLNFRAQNNWVQQKVAFKYTNNDSPAYILATFSTNKTAGEGKVNDNLWIDDIVLIYNTRLATLTVNGAGVAGFNPNVTTYNYPTPICEGVIPTVDGTCQSAHARDTIIHNPTTDEPYTIIRVKHQNQESTVCKDYTINYTIIPAPAAPTVSAPAHDCSPVAHPVTMTASSPGATAYRWYTTEIGSSYTEITDTSHTEYGLLGTVTYYVSALNSNGCESGRTAVTATVNQLPTVSINPVNAICRGQNAILTATGAESYSWSNGTTTSTDNPYTVTPTENTTYTVTGTDNNNCSNTATVTVTVDSLPAAPTSITAGSHCGTGTVTLSATPAAGTGCQWFAAETGGSVLPNGNGNSYTTPSISSSTTYYVASHNSTTGCSSARQAVVATINPLPTVIASANKATICNGDTTTLTATGATSYSWNNNVDPDNKVTPNTTTTYTVTGTDGNGCTNTATVTVTVNSLPAAPTGITAGSHCGTGTVTLSATPAAGTGCQWFAAETGGVALETGNSYTTPSISSSTTYYVASHNNTTGCSSARQAVVATIDTLPTVTTSANNATICNGNSTTISASGATSYIWSNADEGNNIEVSPNTTTTYTVTGTDGNGCTNTATVTITVDSLPAAPTGITAGSHCGTGTVTLSATPAAGTGCQWFAAETGGVALETGNSYTTPSISSSTTYYVASHNSTTGCSSARQAVVATIDTLPTVTASANNGTICRGNSTTLSASGATFYNWDNNAGEGNYRQVSPLDTTTYTVTGTDDNNCSNTATVTVNVNQLPTVTASVNNGTICRGNSTTLSASGATSYSWDNNAGEGNYRQVSPLDTTTYTVTGTDDNGCSNTATVTVNVNQLPTVTASANKGTICNGDTTTLTATGATSYSWDNELGTGDEKQVTPSTTTIYTVIGTDDNTCSNTATVTVNVNNLPTINITPISPLCKGQSATLTASGATSFSWDNELGSGNGIEVTPDTTTTYTVIGTDDNTCSNTASITVTVNENPAAPSATTDTICVSGQAILTAVPADNCSCEWFNSNYGSISQGISNESKTLTTNALTSTSTSSNTYYMYYVRSRNNSTHCFSDYTEIQVVVAPVLGAPTVSDNARCGEGDITLTATPGSNANTCRWYNANSELVFEGTSYEIQDLDTTTSFTCKSYNDIYGCESSANNSRTAIATIYPIPAQPTVQGNNPICGSDSLTLTGTPSANATVCRWINGEDTTTNNSINTGNLTVTTNFTVQSYHASRGCASENLTVTVVVNTLPNAPQTGNDTQCLGTPVTLTASSAEENIIFRWYASAQDNTILAEASEFHPSNLVVGTNNFYAEAYNTLTGCTSANRSMATANMIDAPAIPNVADTAHCGPAAFTLNIIDPQNNTTYKWYEAAQGGVAIHTGTSFTTGELDSTTHYYVSAAVANYDCESGRKNVTITINSIPANPVVNGNEAICAGQTLTVSASSDAAATNFVWSDGQNNTEGDSLTTPTLEDNASYTVKAYNANTNCESEEVNFTVAVNPNPGIPKVGSDTQCEHDTIMLTAFAATGCTSYWYTSQESTESFANGDFYSTSTLPVGTTTYYVSQRDDITNCESERITVEAIINPTYAVNYPVVACDSFQWNNETFTESGNYERTLHTQLGCDSVVTLQLTINYSKVTHFDTTVCDLYVWNNQSYNTSDVYVQSFHTTQNCDSTVYAHVTVKKSTIGTDHIYLCSNELPYNYNNLYEVTAAGTFTIHTDNAAGCDSTITLTVTVNAQPAIATNLMPAARCGEGTVTLTAHAGQNGTTCRWYSSEEATEPLATNTQYTTDSITTTTTYYVSSYNEYNGHPCESGRQAIIATINTNPAEPTVENQVRCGNGTVTFSATVDENANTCLWYPTQSTTNVAGTGLNFTPNNTINTTAVNGTTFYVESYNSNTSCKSTRIPVTATAFVIPSEPVLSAMSNCGPQQFSINAPANGYYNWYDSNESTSTLDIQNNTTPMVNTSRSYFISHAIDYTGITCESGKAELVLTIYPVYEPQDLYDTLCQNETYTQHGLNEAFNQAGSFDRVINTVSSTNCDSLVTLHLWVKEIRSFAFDTTVCDTYTWNNETFTESENITRHFTSSIGCDSVVTVSLTVNKSVQTEFDATDCDEYTWNNETYNASGDYVQHFFTVHGCDSMVSLHLTINNSVETQFSDIACDTYQWNNETYTTSGDYVQHFSTSKGCDSTVTLHLTINYSNSANLTDAVCAGTRYNANGFDTTFNVAGSYTLVRHDLNQSGCDSTTTLTLKVNPIYNQHVTLTICETALPYTWNDITYPVNTEGGDYEHTYSTQTVAGCDSIVTLHLTISNQYVTPLTQDICEGESITFANQTLSQSGIYYDTLQASNHCDSIIMLTLTVHELHTTTLEASICLGESYTNYDFDVTPETSGPHTYQRVVQTEFGCDSTINLNLNVNPVYYTEEEASTCDYTEYIWDGHNKQIGLLQAGTYIIWDSLKTVNGCDSIFKLNLTVNPSYFYPETATVCDNEEYIWEGHNVQIGLLDEGNYIIWDSLKTVNQCDSVYQLTLTVNPTFYAENEGSTCANEAYVWQGHEHINIGILEAGEHTIWDSLKTVNNCDSVYKLTLTVYPTFYNENEGNTCANEVYVWQGHEHINIGLLEAGEYIIWDSLETINHCDSVYKLTLTVTPVFYEENEGTTCDNEAYVWQGHEYINIGIKSAGEYIIWDSLHTDTYACDSIYKLTLTVNETKHTDLYESICAGDYYEYNNEYYEENGDYDIHFQTALGCDSLVTLHLTVNPVYSIDTNITICQGMLPYNFADTIFYASGSKDIMLHTQHGCDSIFHINLNVTPYITVSQTITICDNELPYHFLDSTFSTAGVYDVTETFEDGCNRITTVTLIVNPTYEITLDTTVCDQFVWNSETYTVSGDYTQQFQTIKSCDSTVTYHVTVNYSKDTLLTPVICQGESYEENGFSLNPTEAGIVYDTLHLQCVGTGCDSTVYLELTVAPSYNFEPETATVCDNDEYVWAGHNVQIGQRGVGVYTFTDSLSTVNFGCDSVHTLILTVTPTYSFEAETATICDNEEYVWAGHEYIQIGQRVAGTYTIYDSLHTATYACDSVHTLVLTVTPTYSFAAETATVCENAEYVWASHEYIQIGQRDAGTYTIYDSLSTAIYGCDSVHTLILTVTPIYYQEVVEHTCDNEAYVWEGHNVEIGILDAGVYTIWDSLTTTFGCDSVYMLSLTVTPTFYAEETDTVCDNEAYVWEGHNVQIGLLEPGIHTIWDSLSTTYGCDSVYKLTLTVNHAVTENHTLTVCQSELPYTWRDKTFGTETTVGEHQFTYEMVTVQGCDSIVNLTLTVNPNNIYFDDPISFCEGGSYVWNNQTITESGTYTDTVDNQYGCYDVNILVVTVNPVYHYTEYDTVCDNELPVVWQGRQINQAGTHTADYQTINSCDSIYTLVLTVNPTYYTPETATVCDNEEYVWEGHNVQIGQRAAGTYTIWDSLTTDNGCDSVYMLTLTVTPTYNFAPVTATVCDNEEYVWEGHEYIQIGQRAAGNYTIYDSLSTAIYGCDSVHTLILTVTPTYNFEPVTATVCDNDEYVWEGHNVQIGQRAAGSYTIYDSLSTAIYGCDSIHTLILTVTPTYNMPIETATVCDNEVYVWEGHENITIGQLQAGIYTFTDSLSTAIYGCDSIHTLILTVTPTYNMPIENATVCDNEEYVWAGHEYITIGQRAAGTYTIYDSLSTTTFGCDSIHTLVLTVTPTYNFQAENATVCDNEEYVWVGHEYITIRQRTAGTYTIYDSLTTTTYDCDSIYTLILTVTPTYNFQAENATVCDNEEYVWAGHERVNIGQLEAGVYTFTDSLSTTTFGCDSIHTLVLTVTPTYNFEPETASVCDNEEYVWEGHNVQIGQRSVGTYTIYDSLSTTTFGCDSVHTLILTVTPTYNFDPETATVCDNDEYVWAGHESVVIGQLGEGVYTFTDSLSTAIFGCDSIHTLILTVNPTKHSVETASACSNEEVYSWHNRDITATGIYYDTLVTSLGCDSVCELRFTLLEPTFAVYADTTCTNAEYQGYGFNVTPTLSGDTTLVRMTENVAGCDSTITVNLYVKPLAYSSFDTIVCGAFQWNNRWYTESGEYQQSFTAANGCDSIVTLNLTIDTPSRDTIEVVACESYEWDGTIYTQSGVFSKIYPQAVGCDSIAVMMLTINHNTEVTLYDTTCQAHRYQEYGFDTLTLQAGTFNLRRIDVNAAGCDSIINLVLTVHSGYMIVDSAVTCDNDDFVWHGIHCDTTGVYYKNYETVYGCDSVFVLFLTINPTYEVDVTDTAIVGINYNNHGLNFTPQNPGTLNIDVPRTATNGCDSTVHVTLVITDGNSIDMHYLDKHITLFPNPTENVFNVSSTIDIIRELTIYDNNGRAVLRQSINDYSGQVNVENLTPGIYFVRMTTPDNIVTKKLIVR